MSLYESLGVRRVINACGIYTRPRRVGALGPSVWAAAEAANATWAAMDELLRRHGRADRRAVRGAAARVVPGASAGIALAVGACIARGDGRVAEALPLRRRRRADAARARVQVRALRGAGGRAGGVGRTTSRRRSRRRRPPRSCTPRTSTAPRSGSTSLAPLARARACRSSSTPRSMSFPLSELERWSSAGDVACFSAKYFWGPNGGGFVAGPRGSRRGRRGAGLHRLRVRRVADVRARVQARPGDGRRDRRGAGGVGRRSTTTRGSRATRRWREALAARCARCRRRVERTQFTLDERLVRRAGQRGARCAGAIRSRWRPRSPRATRASGRCVDGDALVFCTEALTDGEVRRDRRRAAVDLAKPGRWLSLWPESARSDPGPLTLCYLTVPRDPQSIVVVSYEVAPRAHRVAEGRQGAHLSSVRAAHAVRGPCADLARLGACPRYDSPLPGAAHDAACR